MDGYALQDNTLIVAGAILTAAVAMVAELILAFLQKRVTPKGLREQSLTEEEATEIPTPAPASR